MIGARSSPKETSLLSLVDNASVVSMFSDLKSIGVAVSRISNPLLEMVPRFSSLVPAKPVDGGTATGQRLLKFKFDYDGFGCTSVFQAVRNLGVDPLDVTCFCEAIRNRTVG